MFLFDQIVRFNCISLLFSRFRASLCGMRFLVTVMIQCPRFLIKALHRSYPDHNNFLLIKDQAAKRSSSQQDSYLYVCMGTAMECSIEESDATGRDTVQPANIAQYGEPLQTNHTITPITFREICV